MTSKISLVVMYPKNSIISSFCLLKKPLLARRSCNCNSPKSKSYSKLIIPKTISLPPYVTGEDYVVPHSAEIKSPQEINDMRPACLLAASILKFVGNNLKIGMRTDEIDALVYAKCIEAGAYPSPLNFKGFPKSVCTSVNEVVCHGIPGSHTLKNGDIINVDVTVFYKGYHGDTSETFIIGEADEQSKSLVKAAERCRDAGIRVCSHGTPLSVIGDIIYNTATEAGFQVVPFFCGHGIGRYFHGPPDIVHVPCDLVGDQKMLEGMTFTIEPILCDGSPDIRIEDDGWTVVTQDGSRSAQFEHTILVSRGGFEILTMQA
uniref:Methionine aminopeptidase n=1 Tax=Biomphalaria glabrata TaxID=6526 RepID=A0A2C9JMS0_BIOGL